MKLGQTNIQNNKLQYKNNNPSFTNAAALNGALNVATKGLQWCDKNPMYGISVIDLSSMIGPRTVIDTHRNGFAGAETFLRESSGLIVNCLTPGLIVLGLAKSMKSQIMGPEFKTIDSHKIWADESSINSLTKSWKLSHGKTAEEKVLKYVSRTFSKLEALDGNEWKSFSKLDKNTRMSFYKELSDEILNPKSGVEINPAKLKTLHDSISTKLNASRSIKFKHGRALNSNLEELIRDTYTMGKAFSDKNVSQNLDLFTKRLKTLVKSKSFMGLAVVCATASTVQAINRYITKKRSGSDGFVGYKDYGKEKHVLTKDEKSKLRFHKAIASAGMIGLALFSMKGFNLKKLQFKGIFPTMDQCRIVSTTTFIGRIGASSDDNELRESTFRDALGFANLYLLGDYVSKGTSSLIEKFNKNVKLLNRNGSASANAGMVEKAKHWITNVSTKSFHEVPENAKKFVTLSQASGLLYSCVALGLFVPILNKKMTEANEAKRKAALNTAPNTPIMPMIASRKALSAQTKAIYSAFIK